MTLTLALAPALVSVSLPISISPQTVALRVFLLLPLIGGYLLAREGKGNLVLEILAVLLLVLATVVPTTPPPSTFNGSIILNNFLARLPAALFLLGLAFVRDGGLKLLIGIALIVLSLITLPSALFVASGGS
jgi:hypothetical protein